MEYRDAYVRRMIVNEFLSWRRRWARVTPVARIELVDADEPDVAIQLALPDSLAGALATLPRRQPAAVVLRYYCDLSDAEIATVMRCRAVTVRGYVARALRSLRVNLSESGDCAIPVVGTGACQEGS